MRASSCVCIQTWRCKMRKHRTSAPAAAAGCSGPASAVTHPPAAPTRCGARTGRRWRDRADAAQGGGRALRPAPPAERRRCASPAAWRCSARHRPAAIASLVSLVPNGPCEARPRGLGDRLEARSQPWRAWRPAIVGEDDSAVLPQAGRGDNRRGQSGGPSSSVRVLLRWVCHAYVCFYCSISPPPAQTALSTSFPAPPPLCRHSPRAPPAPAAPQRPPEHQQPVKARILQQQHLPGPRRRARAARRRAGRQRPPTAANRPPRAAPWRLLRQRSRSMASSEQGTCGNEGPRAKGAAAPGARSGAARAAMPRWGVQQSSQSRRHTPSRSYYPRAAEEGMEVDEFSDIHKLQEFGVGAGAARGAPARAAAAAPADF